MSGLPCSGAVELPLVSSRTEQSVLTGVVIVAFESMVNRKKDSYTQSKSRLEEETHEHVIRAAF